MFIAFFIAIPAAIIAAGAAIIAALAWLSYKGQEVMLDLGSAGLEAAGSLIDGLVSGISSGAGAVYDAISAMAEGAIAALKSVLKIASPSAVFEDFGGFTAEGFIVGVEGETPAVQSSLEAMVTPPKPALQPAFTGEIPASGGGGSAIDLSGTTFNFYGVKDAEDAEARISDALTRLLEGDALQLGAT
jgi:hypothetical protein